MTFQKGRRKFNVKTIGLLHNYIILANWLNQYQTTSYGVQKWVMVSKTAPNCLRLMDGPHNHVLTAMPWGGGGANFCCSFTHINLHVRYWSNPQFIDIKIQITIKDLYHAHINSRATKVSTKNWKTSITLDTYIVHVQEAKIKQPGFQFWKFYNIGKCTSFSLTNTVLNCSS